MLAGRCLTRATSLLVWLTLCCCICSFRQLAAEEADALQAEQRALAYLSGEVPRWRQEHDCFSCHNNGDGARALYVASAGGSAVNGEVIASTTQWLSSPDQWKDNGGDPAFSDKTLASLQFAAALAAADRAGLIGQREPLEQAGQIIADLQDEQGHWPLEGSRGIGAPADWGQTLATAMARDTLQHISPSAFAEPIARADGWLRRMEPQAVTQAAAILMALGNSRDAAARQQQARCLDIIRRAEGPEGGWGPYITARAEPFDTALVLLSLCRLPADEHPELESLIVRGRRYLTVTQQADGSWLETTRPAGAVSYAQRVSTAAWCAEALVRTRMKGEG